MYLDFYASFDYCRVLGVGEQKQINPRHFTSETFRKIVVIVSN